jgi:hypothetical protein
MKYYIIKQENDPAKFVEFWTSRYDYRSEYKYSEEIDQRPLKPDSIRNLFAWKAMRPNRKSIQAREHPFVETVIANFDRFCRLPLKTPEYANTFLANELKAQSGMIWKIFALHILHPDLYPIFDQNVYRAMHYMQTDTTKEIPSKGRDKQSCYINEYLPFFNAFNALKHYPDRKLDKALFSFGQFLKIPLERSRELNADRGEG